MPSKVKDVLHHIYIKLYKSNLPGTKGRWFARTAKQVVLDIEKVADSLVTRGGYTGSHSDMIYHVREYFSEAAFLLADGYTIDTGYFKIIPVVKGSFKNQYEEFDPHRHRIEFHFRPLKPLRRLAKFISVIVSDRTGKGVPGSIKRFVDVETGTHNQRLTPGGMFIVEGRTIKITGGKDECGMWFVSKDDPQQRYKVTKILATNTAGTISSIVPALPAGAYTIEIKTLYTISGVQLKSPRPITGGFTLTAE